MGKSYAARPQTARSAQHKTQAKRDKRQIQVANNRGQVTNRKAASRQEAHVTRGEGTNTDPQQPASARSNPSQNLTALAPLAQTGPTTSAALARISLARRTVSACIGSRQPIIARANEALLTQHRRNPFVQLR